jgi:ribosome-associated protein
MSDKPTSSEEEPRTGNQAGEEDRSETRMPDESEAWLLAERICWHILEKQGEDLVVLDLRGRSDVCDFFVLGTGNSDVQVRAIAKNIQDQLLPANQKVRGLEGMNEGRWALLDFFDVVVHVFQPDTRDFFQIERLWGDAGRLEIAPEWFGSDEVAARHPDLNFATAAGGGSD